MKIALLAVSILLVAVSVGGIIKINELKKERALAKSPIRAVTHLNNGEVKKAQNIIDIVYFRPKFPEEYAELAKQIFRAFSTHLFEVAKKESEEGNLASAHNNLRVGINYAKEAGADPPEWVIELEKKLYHQVYP